MVFEPGVEVRAGWVGERWDGGGEWFTALQFYHYYGFTTESKMAKSTQQQHQRIFSFFHLSHSPPFIIFFCLLPYSMLLLSVSV
jgi:hypothetical protein